MRNYFRLQGLRSALSRATRATSLMALCVFAQSATAQGFDWNSTKSRESIDGWLRKLAEQCGQLGFTALTPPEPATMEKRIYSRLLLKPKFEADAEVNRWGGFVAEMQNLAKPDAVEAAAERAGAALTAATVDPSSHEAARRQYVQSITGAMTPFLNACRSAAADPFVGANYLSGSGSLAAFERKAEEQFDGEVKKVSE